MEKRKYLSLFLVLILALISLTFRFEGREINRTELLKTVYDVESLRGYYHSSIPGLSNAEELGLVKPLHKTIPIPDTDLSLKLDRIWYGELGGYILYHVDNREEDINLGGIIIDKEFEGDGLPEDSVSIKDPPGRGVIYNGGYYSYAELPPIDKIIKSGEVIFKPVLSSQGEVHDLEGLPLDLNTIKVDEPYRIIKLGTSMGLGKGHLNLIKLKAGASHNRIYFTYDDPDYVFLYRIDGRIYGDNGAGLSIHENVILADREENVYYINTLPFEKVPTLFSMEIHSIILIGRDPIRGEFDTDAFKEKKGLYTVNKSLQRAYDMDITLTSIEIRDDNVKIQITFTDPKNGTGKLSFEPGSLFSKGQKELLKRINSRDINLPNTINIWNDIGKEPESIDITLESSSTDPSINLIIPLDFWQVSNKLIFSIENPTLSMDIDKRVDAGKIDID